MNPLLIYFREECIELWSLDNNGRLLPVLYNSSNKLPLYFLLSGDQILMDNFAKQSYLTNSPNSFGDFWSNLSNDSIKYERFLANNTFATLLPYVFKESILPSIAKSHFNSNLPSLLNQSNFAILFDSFVEDDHKEIILNLFFQIVGLDPNSLISIDFFDCFRDLIINNNLINQTDSFLLTNISNGNIYFHLIGRNSPSHLGKKVLEGKGHDPVLDVVLDFLVEIAHAKGSLISLVDLRKELKNDAIAILGKIPGGLVLHTIKNSNIDVSPLRISFHRNDIEGRINNRQSLNFIHHEFDSFIKQNNAELLPIFLSGKVINELVFRDFFSSIYSKVIFENDGFDKEFTIYCLKKNADNKISNKVETERNYTQKNTVTETKTVLPPLPTRPSSAPINIKPNIPPLPTTVKPKFEQEINVNAVNDTSSANGKAYGNSLISPPPINKPDLKLPPGVKKNISEKSIPKLIPPPPPPPPPPPVNRKK